MTRAPLTVIYVRSTACSQTSNAFGML
jgi:hypothetical protein